MDLSLRQKGLKNCGESYFIESALLGQGLPGITEEELESLWPENPDGEIAWMKAGTLITGGISKFVRFRKETENCARICYQNFETAAEQKRTGFLTASGTMKACGAVSTICSELWNRRTENATDYRVLP